MAALLLALPACTLIDQRTFDPDADRAPVLPKPPAPPPAPPSGPTPLFSIAPDTVPAIYTEAVKKAVADARARKPDVVFDVVEMQPPPAPGTPADAQAAAPLGRDALAVARLIVAQGIPPARVRLIARPDASATPREVRVFVH